MHYLISWFAESNAGIHAAEGTDSTELSGTTSYYYCEQKAIHAVDGGDASDDTASR